MKILFIEDDQVIADLVKKGLSEAGYSVSHVTNGITGLAFAKDGIYDLAIIDIMLPGMDGFSIIESIRENKLNIPILILSAKRTVDDRINGLRHGSDDYMTKPFSFSELLARIEALLRRANHITEPSSLSIDDLKLDLLSRKVIRNGKRIDLQPKEFSLLEYLIRNKNRIVSKTMIMERVWNYDFDPGTNVVEARISKLREKVDKDFDIPLIHTVRGLGYVVRVGND